MYDQLVKHHDPSTGSYGDCYRTCIANYLGLHPSEVPGPDYEGDPNKPVLEWLHRRGLSIARFIIPASSIKEANEHLSRGSIQGMYIMSGKTQLGGVCHSCLYERGKVVHDPIGGDGIHSLLWDTSIGGYVEVKTVVLQPAGTWTKIQKENLKTLVEKQV